MCLGIPMRVEQASEDLAWCEGRGERRRVSLLLVGAQAAGTWLLVANGTAQRVLGAEEAQRIDSALDGLEAALAGDAELDRYFADLVDHEPQLPPHLRGAPG